jgi:hypothetical protein
MFGKKSFHNDENQMHEMMDNGWEGVIYDHPMPAECGAFIEDQYKRFKIPTSKHFIDLYEMAYRNVLWLFGSRDPYNLFFGLSDVEMTHDWMHYTYELTDDNRFVEELHPEKIETFVYVPGQCEAVFEKLMSMPGLKALPNYLGDIFEEMLDGDWTGERAIDCLPPLAIDDMMDLCTLPDGMIDQQRVKAYIELAQWAALLWFIGPYGRSTRMMCHCVVDVAIRYGEAVLSDACV